MGIRYALAFALAVASFGMTEARASETDQIAQASLVNRSAKAIRACLGEPARRIPVGDNSIWVYPIGATVGDGPTFLFLEDLNWLKGGQPCDVRIVFDRYRSLVVNTTLSNGAMLPLGQVCRFAAEPCQPGPLR